MSPLLLLSLLSLSLFVPVMTGDDDGDEAAPVAPDSDDPSTEPGSLLDGTEGADDLTAGTNDTVEAGAGDDILSVEEGATGAVLNAGDGADTLTITGEGNTGNGGLGQDVLTVTGNNTANGDEGDDTLTATDTADATLATLNGGGGDDVLAKSYSDTSGDLRVVMNGGNGNDILQVDLQLNATLADTPDVLTGGGSADTFRLDLLDATSADAPASGLITSVEITDFDGAEDSLVIDASSLAPDGEVRTVDSTIFNESEDGTYTDIVVTFIEDTTPTTLRLFGVTGLQASDVTFATA